MADIILANIVLEYMKPTVRKVEGRVFRSKVKKDNILVENVVITPPVEFYYKKWFKDKYGLEEPARVLEIIPIKVIGQTNY